MRKLLTIMTIGLYLLSGGTMAADTELRPITHEDVWLMQRLGTPVISPDGRIGRINALSLEIKACL